MFVGHMGAALALKKADRRINAGLLVFAALWLDIALWLLVLTGVEQVQVPADFAIRRYQTFRFPYSHSLLAAAVWAGLAFAATRAGLRNSRSAAVAGLAVFSHFVLDWIEHPPEMPLAGDSSMKVGLGLWDHLGIALGLELALAAVGLGMYLAAAQDVSRGRKIGIAVLIGLLSIMAVGGQLTAREAPPSTFAAVSSLMTISILSLVVFFLDRKKSA
jgi:membrane-bound metal-dependent hydrolase YbcI (DUF457 family)